MFSRHADAGAVAIELGRLYPAAPDDLLTALVAKPPRPGPRLTSWVHEQVRRAAARRAAATTGLDRAPYPADGEESLRVYLPSGLADLATHEVPADEWARARQEAWGDHGDALVDDREREWAERLADDVESTLVRWRDG